MSDKLERHYFLQQEETVMVSELEKADPEQQKRVMRAWFLQNYADPNECCPYESAEGGYQFIWGGPYDARQELEAEFGGVVPEEVIRELADELSEVAYQWSGDPSQDVDESLFDSIGGLSYGELFSFSIAKIEALLTQKIDPTLKDSLLALLFANVITALETYLFEFFVDAIKKDPQLLRKLVETTSEFRERKFPLSEVFKKRDDIDEEVKKFLLSVSWHNLGRVRPLYKDVLGIELLAEESRKILAAVSTRHDLIHRNGRTVDGVEVIITEDRTKDLMQDAETLVRNIETSWMDLTSPF